MRTLFSGILFQCCVLTVPLAQAGDRVIGSWAVHVEDDQFTEEHKYVIVTISPPWAFGVRCFSKEYSVVLLNTSSDGEINKDDLFTVKYRIDKSKAEDTVGSAFSSGAIQLFDPAIPIASLLEAKQLAMRITNASGTSSDVTFPLRRTKEAFTDFLKECPADAPPEKTPSQ